MDRWRQPRMTWVSVLSNWVNGGLLYWDRDQRTNLHSLERSACEVRCSRRVQLFGTPRTADWGLLCPLNFSGKSPGVSYHFLLQGISPSQGLNRSLLQKGNGYPLQYSGLENSTDRGGWQATVHGVTKSQTALSDFDSPTPALAGRFFTTVPPKLCSGHFRFHKTSQHPGQDSNKLVWSLARRTELEINLRKISGRGHLTYGGEGRRTSSHWKGKGPRFI